MGGFTDFTMDNIIPSDKNFFYRNKMEFSFSDKRWISQEELKSGGEIERNFALGLHVPNVFDKVLDLNECFLQSELSNKILNLTRTFFKAKNILPYTTKTHTGFLRNLVIKTSHHNDDLMVNLVTSSEDNLLLKEYVDLLTGEIPQVTTIVNNISLKKAAIATGDYENVLYGSGFISDSIGKYLFRISANSFFQTNTLQAEKLYQTALDFAGLNGDEIVYDLYSGAGTISIFVSGNSKNVFAFESVESAVKDAEENKKINGIKNVHFIKADLYKSFIPVVELMNIPAPDIYIIDPPRSGMHQTTVEDVIKSNPEKVVYVSCNPATQVRDIKLLVKGGFKLIKIQPVDMFPHTFHIENVALLTKG
jgi:23S rRNA (uracil1939-C5)-methyltransferase